MIKRGRGMACMWYPIGFTVAANPSAATVKVNTDGTATLLTGTVETGQGALTVLAQIAAETLGLATDDVHVVSGDTDITPMDTGAIASRTTYVTGNAIVRAAEKARDILFEAAAPLLNVKPDQLEVRDRRIQVLGFPARSIAIDKVVHHSETVLGNPAIGSASYNPPTVDMDPETGQGKPFNTYVYATQIADVEVDDETGEVEILKIVAVHDCGTPINPMLVEGQIQGGISMGVGFALQEEILFEEGRQINPNLTNYIMPTQPRHAGNRGWTGRQLRSHRSIRRQGRRRAHCGTHCGMHHERHLRRGRGQNHCPARDGRASLGRHQRKARGRAGRRSIGFQAISHIYQLVTNNNSPNT